MNKKVIRKNRVRSEASCFLVFLFSFFCLGCSSQTGDVEKEQVASIFKQGEKVGERAELVIDGATYYFRWAPAGLL